MLESSVKLSERAAWFSVSILPLPSPRSTSVVNGARLFEMFRLLSVINWRRQVDLARPSPGL